MAAVVNDCGEPWARAGWRGGRGGPRLTFLLHASPEALLEPAVAALVPLVFVHHALPAKSAGVHVVLPHAPPEEALAAITARGAVVFACGPVPTDGAQGTDAQVVGRVEVGAF